MHGPVLNPHDKTRSAGGSSSGSCVLVAVGELDAALAGDQGGSVRIPASMCGIVGLKPTFGLVPYTGVCSIEPTIDCLGPVTRTVRECALMMEVLAGYDGGLDPRQPCNIAVPKYSEEIDTGIAELKLGMLKEGFEVCEEFVTNDVWARFKQFEKWSGTIVLNDVSIPSHKTSKDVWTVICCEGFYNTAVKTGGTSTGYRGFYQTSYKDTLVPRFMSQAHNLSETAKLGLMIGRYADSEHHGRYYCKAQNLVTDMKRKYDEALEKYDALVMPTLPYRAPELPTCSSTLAERLTHAFGMVPNTAPFCMTGHPALTVNASRKGESPVGVMFVGRHFDETTLLKIARAFEKFRDSSD